MAEDEDQEISAALAKLAEQDRAAAEDARAALEWIAGEQGRASITQERIQGFCWYELPVKWFVELDEKLRVAAALAEALDLLQLPGTPPSAGQGRRARSSAPMRPAPHAARPPSAGPPPPPASSRPTCRSSNGAR